MSQLKSIIETCTPRPDVLEGGLDDSHFAVQLDRVMREPENYPLYGDPEQFFELTWPTQGLRDLLRMTFGRFAGLPGMSSGLIRSETSFGGGKTHGLIALYHIAKGARPEVLKEFVDPSIMPERCQIAGVVGDRLDSVNAMDVGGIEARTLWGVIAAQFGAEAYEAMRASDETRTVPAKGKIEEIVGDVPTVVVVDEIAHYLRMLNTSGDEDVRRMADAVPAFLKSLLEVASERRNLVVVLTLASNADAYSSETEEVNAALERQMAEISSVTARNTKGSSIVKPAEDSEIAEILKRRLFSNIDRAAALAAAKAYGKFYSDLSAKGEVLTGGAEKAAPYGELIESSYPFHPELIRVLDKRLGTIPDFQRARGALKLLAEAVAGIWDEPEDSPYQHPEIINVADLDYDRPELLLHLTAGLKKPQFENVALADFSGADSHAYTLDAERSDRLPYAARAARTVFTHSLETHGAAGASRAEIIVGTARIGDNPDIIIEALNRLDATAWYLGFTGVNYRFSTEPNANNIISTEMATIPMSAVKRELDGRIEDLFTSFHPVKTVVRPSGPADVPDEPELRLVVLHHDDVTVTMKTASPAPAKVMGMYDRQGASETPRSYRNAVAFLVADADAVQDMVDKVRRDKAAQDTVNNPDRLRDFSKEVQQRLTEIADSSRIAARGAISACYRHLYIPDSDKSTGYLRHEDATAQNVGNIRMSETQRIVEWMKGLDGVVRDKDMSTTYLKSKVWGKTDSITTKELLLRMWRDNTMPYLLDVNRLTDVIRSGIDAGAWVYWDSANEKAYTKNDPSPPVRLDDDVVLYTPEEAQNRGLLGRAPKVADVVGAMGARQTTTGGLLLSGLTSVLGKEPSEDEIKAVLVKGAETSDLVVVSGGPKKGAAALTADDIKDASMKDLHVLLPAKAEKVGVIWEQHEASDAHEDKTASVEATGPIGSAFQKAIEMADDTEGSDGLTFIKVEVVARGADEVQHMRELSRAAAMVPLNAAYDKTVDLDVALTYADSSGTEFGSSTVAMSTGADQMSKLADKLFAFATSASDASGDMTLTIAFHDPVATSDRVIDRIRKPLTNLELGDVTVTVGLN